MLPFRFCFFYKKLGNYTQQCKDEAIVVSVNTNNHLLILACIINKIAE